MILLASKQLLLTLRCLAVLLASLILVYASIASALDKATQGLLFPMYGDNELECGSDNFAQAGDLSPSSTDNMIDIFNFLYHQSGLGLTPIQIAGILGNLQQESGFNPNLHQNHANLGPLPVNGVGFGIAQWTFTSRQAPLVALANKMGKPATNLQVQEAYIVQELTGSHKHALAALKTANTVEDATFKFHNTYEGSADSLAAIRANRVRYANDNLKRLIDKGIIKDTDINVAGEGGGGVGAGGVCSTGAVTIDGLTWPRAPRAKNAYAADVLPVCKHPEMDGPYGTSGGIYTDRYGNRNAIKTCHHDATPAFDLMAGNGGQEVYAISEGMIVSRGTDYGHVSGCTEIQFKSTAPSGGFYYWYGHMMNPDTSIPLNKVIPAGTKIAYIATSGAGGTRDFGDNCYGGGPHLHIDRGCSHNGQPQRGGNQTCRSPEFLQVLGKLYEALTSTEAPRSGPIRPI